MNQPAQSKILLLALTLLAVAGPLATAASNDALLNMLPEDTLFCLRVNEFNATLGRVDQYLMGASPLPVSMVMLANMQLAGIVGDPMLTNIDKDGAFMVVGIVLDDGDVDLTLIAPMTDYQAFIENNPACSPSTVSGVTLLNAPGSPVGTLVLTPAPGGQYALVNSEDCIDAMTTLQKQMAAKGSKLAARLDAEQAAQAVAAPVWGYVNFERIYDLYGPALLSGINAMMAEMPDNPAMAGSAELNVAMMTLLVENILGQTDAMTLALTPEPAVLNMDIALRAKDGGELAAMLTADPNAPKGFSLAGFSNDAAAVNCVFKTNHVLLGHIIEAIDAVMTDIVSDTMTAEQSDRIRNVMTLAMDAMGKETFISYTYGAGAPPFAMRQVQDMTDPSAYRALMHAIPDVARAFYEAIDAPADLTFEPDVETYKNVAIDKFTMKFEDDGDEFDVFEMMYGIDEFVYYLAHKDNLLLTTFGPNAVGDIKTLIDAPTTGPAAGELQQAMTLLGATAQQADMVGSINIIKLVKGMFQMIQHTGMSAEFFGPLAAAFDVPTQSCMAATTSIADGKMRGRLALPKQHLMEVLNAGMQAQQHFMQMQMQMQMEMQQQMDMDTQMDTQAMPGEMMVPPATSTPSLQDWVGQAAPDLTLSDLQGNAVSIAEHKGKKIVLDFWATWCPPCREMVPDLIELRSSRSNDQLAIICISDESATLLNNFAAEHNINYSVVSHRGALPEPYSKVVALPTTFLIDSKGMIRHIMLGYHSLDDLNAALDSME